MGRRGIPLFCNEINAKKNKARFIKLFCKKGSTYSNKHKEWEFVQIMEIKAIPCEVEGGEKN